MVTTFKQPWKTLAFLWSLPMTAIGVLWALVLGAKWYRQEPDDWSLHFICPDGGRGQSFLLRFNVAAQTLGATIVYARARLAIYDVLVTHERVHVRQNMKFGPFAPVLYAMASIVAWAYGGDAYKSNDGEEEARYASGESNQPDELKPNGRWL